MAAIAHPPAYQYTQTAEVTDAPDDALAPYNTSPGMTPIQPNTEPEPPPNPITSHPPPSFDSPPGDTDCEEATSTNRTREKPSGHPGEYTILHQLGNTPNRHIDHTEIARNAISHPLPGTDDNVAVSDKGLAHITKKYQDGRDRVIPQGPAVSMALKDLAAGALQAVTGVQHTEDDNDIAATTRFLSIQDVPSLTHDSTATPESVRGRYDDEQRVRSPRNIPTPAGGELPPFQVRETPETNVHRLPSIQATFGDLPLPLAEKDIGSRHPLSPTFPHSPPTAGYRLLPPMPPSRSPPTSPHSSQQRGPLLSPRSLPSTSPYFHPNNGQSHHRAVEFGDSRSPDNFNSENHLPPLPASIDMMSIDGLTHPAGGYVCDFSGCTAPRFQTQYLLNSHANVHSSNRPHYCPVPGCSRGEGGKGFKRKNEMIRHGLVHDSPGYICPFCPDREHKYPRPDNLQRYVDPSNAQFSIRLRSVFMRLFSLTKHQACSCPPYRGRQRRPPPP